MGKKIPIGIEFYKEMVDKDYYYVDKTLLIKDILDAGTKVSLFTRPRRFGKTLSLMTLRTFFEDERDWYGNKVDNCRYFEGKKISLCGEEYLAKQGAFPVISLTFKSAKQPEFGMAYAALVDSIAEEFRRHQYICEGGVLEEDEINRFRQIIRWGADEKNRDGEMVSVISLTYATALAFLSRCLKKYHGRNVIILIDEYDVPLENSYFSGFYDRMAEFIRSLFESALKTNDALEFAVVTGCLRISKESIFTGLNNLEVISVLNQGYAEYFGFLGEEVREMLRHFSLEEKEEELKKWYDGYLFGNTEVYNPWSVLNYVKGAAVYHEKTPKPYWANTSSNSIVRELVDGAGRDTRKELDELIAGGTIEKPVHEDITYGDIFSSQDNLWNFLFFTGYLKKVGERFYFDRTYITLAIPNHEISYIYNNTILLWFDKKVKTLDRSRFYKALICGDSSVVEEELKRELVECISFYDAAEQFYHGFMVGMLGGLGEYLLRSNREAGNGKPDILMVPEDECGTVLIFELKHVEKYNRMESGCDAALFQIKEKQYDIECREDGFTKFIKYGICFYKKSCRVKSVIEG